MKYVKFLIAFFFLAATHLAFADLNDEDSGVYVILKRDGTSGDLFYRISKGLSGWQAEGRSSKDEWQSISCEQGCQYLSSSQVSIESWFPPDWRANNEIGCINNKANAFCRFSAKGEPGKGGYVMIALVTEVPTPMFFKRLR